MQKYYIIIASLTSHLEDVRKLGGMVHVSLPTTGLVISLTFLLEHIIIYSFGVMRLSRKILATESPHLQQVSNKT